MPRGDIVPPPNLLEQVEGVEQTLRQGRRLGALGWISAAFGLAQAIVAIASAELWQLDLGRLADQWPLWSASAFLVVAAVLMNWTRFWVRESKSPFRYTYSVAPFEPVSTAGELEPGLLGWLERDLAESLSRRIPRLSRLDPDEAAQADAEGEPGAEQPVSGADASHIHIAASYGVRDRRDERTYLEVTPWVRMGPPGAPSTLAHPVRFRLRDPSKPFDDVDAYESVAEWVYFSVATAIYARIEQDVEQKIELLPGSRFRAAAYFHEAEDYVRSNTLDAYDKAGSLYRAVIEIYDPEWRPASAGRLRRSRQWLLRLRARVVRRARVWAARIWPRVAVVHLTAARAHLGYANTLLYRRMLASLSGQRINPVFETRRGTRRAIELLEALPADLPRRREVLFNAYVTLALSLTQLHSDIEARNWLRKAQALHPARAERNARCLYVRGLVEPQLRPRAQLLRQAVEADPGFEVAQFELAKTTEMVWRTRPTFEPNVAEIVFEEYQLVHRLNPGNVVAWGNVGYMHWLLDEDLERARDAYERGRRYKEIKRETFVAQLDYGLARIAAEEPDGRFADAYRHYLDGVTALVASGVSHDPGYSDYQFELIGGPMMRRFEKYLKTVRERWERDDAGDDTTKRERDSVMAFVLNDYGEACVNYLLRFGDPTYHGKALEAFEEASRLSPGFLLPHYNIYRLPRIDDDSRDPLDRPQGAALDRVYEREPNWLDAMLDLVAEDAARVPALRRRAEERRREAEAAQLEASAKRAEASERQAEGLKPDGGDSIGRLAVVSPPPARVAGADGNGAGAPRRQHTESGAARAVERAVAEQVRAAQRGRGPTGPDPRQLQEQADALEARAREQLEQAQSAEDEAERREQEIGELLERLLPQEWLWRQGGDAGTKLLDLSAFKRRDYELRWERELDEIHVRALQAWCATPAAKPEAAECVLRHILERYWTADFGVLREYRLRLLERQPQGAEADRLEHLSAQLLEIVDGWLEGDPEFWKLTWLLEDRDNPDEQRIFTPEEASRRLGRASERHEERVAEGLRNEREAGDPDYIHLWVGDGLEELGRDRDELLAVYRRAAHSTRPEIQEELGVRFGDHGSWRESADAYRAAAAGAADDAALKRCVTGLARALFAVDDHAEAIAELDLLAARAEEDGRWRTQLVERLAAHVATHEAYAALAEWLESPRAGRGKEARRDAAAALVELAGRRYDPVVRAPEAHRAGAERQLPPGATPLLLETDPAFFPAGEQTPELQPMLAALENARAEVRAATGVEIPGVRIRVDPTLTGGRYVVLVREAPVATGWLDPEDRGFHRPMVEHLRRTVVDRLPDFAGFQELHARLGGGADGVRLVQTVQRLVRDRVSIRELDPIVAAYEAIDPSAGLDEAVERVRAQLSPETLGLGESSSPIAVPPALEAALADAVRHDDGKTFVACPRAEAEQLLAGFRELVDGLSEPVVVVRDPRVRRAARRLLAQEHPTVPVLARSELGGPRGLRRVRAVQA